jgi:propanol-preferring alcohol dehydrogenase
MGAAWAGGYDAELPVRLDAAVTFAPSGDVVIAALAAVERGGVVAINAIHLDRVPQFSYDLMWPERELRSVANFTREDARQFLDLAAAIPIRTEVETFPLDAANEGLLRHAEGRTNGTAVLVP